MAVEYRGHALVLTRHYGCITRSVGALKSTGLIRRTIGRKDEIRGAQKESPPCSPQLRDR